jgi:hypothetical protein
MITVPRSAAGADFSLHAIHLAHVNSDGLVTYDVLDLKGVGDEKRAWLIGETLRHYAQKGATHILIEKPFLQHFTNAQGGTGTSAETTIELAAMGGFIRCLATQAGLWVYWANATEWRSEAGLMATSSGGHRRLVREEFKRDAIAMVKVEFGLETKDDNLAEAVLMARVALSRANLELRLPA